MSERLRVLVADDEQVARRRLLRLLRAFPYVDVCGECATGAEVLDRARQGGVDVILLDIDMPEFSGMEAVQLLPDPKPIVIFCTAHAEHAVEAFEVGAIDYLLKPIEAGRLAKAIERVRDNGKRISSAESIAQPPSEAAVVRPATPSARLAISTRNGIVLLDPADVTHALLDGELVTVYTTKSEYLTDFTLQDLEGRLAGIAERVHRKALLNLAHVVCLEPCETGGFAARTRTGKIVQVSRQAARELRRRLGLGRANGEAP
jgi:two-component system, LytTR family, response regulator